jgi:hypothetical protein
MTDRAAIASLQESYSSAVNALDGMAKACAALGLPGHETAIRKIILDVVEGHSAVVHSFSTPTQGDSNDAG